MLDQPLAVQSLGDLLETGRVSEEKINGSNNLLAVRQGFECDKWTLVTR